MNLKKLFGLSAIVFCCLALMPLNASATGIMYVDTLSGSVSSLYTLTTGGVATKVGDIQASAGGNLTLTDIAFDPTTGNMYAITTSALYILDYKSTTGTVKAALIGNTTGASGLQGLEVSSDGKIYADSYPIGGNGGVTGRLYELSKTDGSATPGVNLPNNYVAYGDLAFDSGVLYGSLFKTNGSNKFELYNIGTSHKIGTFPDDDNIDGLAYFPNSPSTGTLYGITRGGTLYTINPSNGALSNSHSTGLSNVYGATYATHTPIPPSAFLLGSGLLGLGLLGWRRKIS
jgi:hypothetical protein